MTDSAKLRLDLPLVLPGVDDARDRCVTRLIELLAGRPGIVEAHIVGPDGPAPELCTHYDPATLSLGRVRELAHAAGAELSAAFGHLLITTAAAMQPRAASRIAESLRNAPGVLEADVAASGAVRIEFERSKTSEQALRDAAAKLGLSAEGPTAEAAEPATRQRRACRPRPCVRRPVRRTLGADLRHPRRRSAGHRLADRVARSRARLVAHRARLQWVSSCQFTSQSRASLWHREKNSHALSLRGRRTPHSGGWAPWYLVVRCFQAVAACRSCTGGFGGSDHSLARLNCHACLSKHGLSMQSPLLSTS